MGCDMWYMHVHVVHVVCGVCGSEVVWVWCMCVCVVVRVCVVCVCIRAWYVVAKDEREMVRLVNIKI